MKKEYILVSPYFFNKNKEKIKEANLPLYNLIAEIISTPRLRGAIWLKAQVYKDFYNLVPPEDQLELINELKNSGQLHLLFEKK